MSHEGFFWGSVAGRMPFIGPKGHFLPWVKHHRRELLIAMGHFGWAGGIVILIVAEGLSSLRTSNRFLPIVKTPDMVLLSALHGLLCANVSSRVKQVGQPVLTLIRCQPRYV